MEIYLGNGNFPSAYVDLILIIYQISTYSSALIVLIVLHAESETDHIIYKS